MNTEILNSELERINDAPFLHLNGLMGRVDVADIFVVLLHTLPTGSHKVLAANSMIAEAERRHRISRDTIFLDQSSGNAAAAEAWVCAAKGYRYLCFVPETIAMEKIRQIRACGGEIHFTPAESFVDGAKDYAEKFHAEDPENRIYLDQSSNPASPKGYAPIAERIKKLFPRVDAYVSGGGTHGTLAGISSILKEHYQDIRVTCIESTDAPRLHSVQNGYEMNQFTGQGIVGFGGKKLQGNARPELYDYVEVIGEDTAIEHMKKVHKRGLLVGKSSAANLYWAERIAEELGPGKVVVTNTYDSFLKMVSEGTYME